MVSPSAALPRDLRSLTRRLECDRSRWRNLDGQAGLSRRPRGFVGAPRRTAAAQRRSGRPPDEAHDPRSSSSGSSRSCPREDPARDLARGPQGPGAGACCCPVSDGGRVFSRRSAACGLGFSRCSSAWGLGFSRCSSACERSLRAPGRLLQFWGSQRPWRRAPEEKGCKRRPGQRPSHRTCRRRLGAAHHRHLLRSSGADGSGRCSTPQARVDAGGLAPGHHFSATHRPQNGLPIRCPPRTARRAPGLKCTG